MKAILFIRRNSDGMIARHPREWDWTENDPDKADYFMWTEGNYGCDCNRSDFFSQAVGIPELNTPCNSFREPNKFSVRLIGLDGVELYRDEDWPTEEEARGE